MRLVEVGSTSHPLYLMGGREGQFTANGGDNLQPSDVESSAVIVYFYDDLVCEVSWTTVSVEGGAGERAGSSGGQGRGEREPVGGTGRGEDTV